MHRQFAGKYEQVPVAGNEHRVLVGGEGQQVGGHSSITMTLDLYSRAIPPMQADAADRIAALIDMVPSRSIAHRA